MNLRALGIIHTGCKSLSRPLMNIIRFNRVSMVKQIKIWPTPSFRHLLNSRIFLNGFLLIILCEEKEAKTRFLPGISICSNVLLSAEFSYCGTKAAKYQISFFFFSRCIFWKLSLLSSADVSMPFHSTSGSFPTLWMAFVGWLLPSINSCGNWRMLSASVWSSDGSTPLLGCLLKYIKYIWLPLSGILAILHPVLIIPQSVKSISNFQIVMLRRLLSTWDWFWCNENIL